MKKKTVKAWAVGDQESFEQGQLPMLFEDEGDANQYVMESEDDFIMWILPCEITYEMP